MMIGRVGVISKISDLKVNVHNSNVMGLGVKED